MKDEDRIWVTKEGKEIRIGDMKDDHLLNALRHCQKMIINYTDMLRCESHPIFGPRGDGAKELFEHELSQAHDAAAYASFTSEVLGKEVERRGLTPLPEPESMEFPEIEEVHEVGVGTIFKLKGTTTGRTKRKEQKMDTTQDNPHLISNYEFFVAGVQHHQMHTIIADMNVNDIFELVPEPTNKYDRNAIRIEYNSMSKGSVMCGYVPKKFSAEVSADMAIGKRLECIITELTRTAKPWEQCKVQIREVKDEVVEEVESDG